MILSIITSGINNYLQLHTLVIITENLINELRVLLTFKYNYFSNFTAIYLCLKLTLCFSSDIIINQCTIACNKWCHQHNFSI